MRIQNLLLPVLALANLVSAYGTPDFALIKSLGPQKLNSILEAHALLGALAWVIIIPTGAIVFALLKVPRLFWIHSTIQTIGLLCLIPSFTLGVIIATAYGKLFNNVHTVLGTVIFAIALAQPIWGILQHRVYRKTGKKSLWALLHRWVGRITLTAAIVNGGLGWILTKGHPPYSKPGLRAYIAVSSIIWSFYVAAVVYETVKEKNSNVLLRSRQQSTQSDASTSDEPKQARQWQQKV